KDSDVDTFGRSNEAKDRITEQTIPPRVVSAVADKDLRDAFLTSKLDNRGDRVVAFEHFGRGAGFFRRVEISSNRDSLSFRPAGLADVHRVELPLKTLFVALSAFDHGWSIGVRGDADKKPLVRSEHRLDAVRMNVRLQLRVDHFGR